MSRWSARTSAQARVGFLAALVTAAVVIGAVLWATQGGSSRLQLPLSHQAYAALYTGAIDGKTTSAVLKKWPKPPYQTFKSPVSKSQIDQCYEWYDKPVALYTLCFNSKGVLDNKAIG